MHYNNYTVFAYKIVKAAKIGSLEGFDPTMCCLLTGAMFPALSGRLGQ